MRTFKVFFILSVIATLLLLPPLEIVPLTRAQEEGAGTARVRIGYFAFDPKGYDSYVDGKLFPFATQLANTAWSIPVGTFCVNTASPFFDFSDGIHSFAFAPKGKNLVDAILGPKDVALEAGHAYSLAIVGSLDAGDLDLLVIDDTRILADTDPQTAFVRILVNNIAGIPAFEVEEGVDKKVVGYGQFSSKLYATDSPILFSVYAEIEGQRNSLFDEYPFMPSGGISDFGAVFGVYPGIPNEDYSYAVNWGNTREITVIDGGTIDVGSEVAGEIAEVAQRVRYTLTLTADTTLTITASGTGQRYEDTSMMGVTTFDPALYVFDAEGRLLDWRDDISLEAVMAGTTDAKLEEIALKAGTYWIEVGSSYDQVSGPFKLVVESVKANNPLPTPTGPYQVGVVWRHWVDETRDELYDETSDAKREVIVEILYPADVSAGAEAAPYIDNREQVLPAWSELLKNAVNLDFNTQPGDLDDFRSHVYPNAPLSEDQGSYPVLIFSIGASADVRMYSAQLEELASHGYIVAAINHAYGAAVTELNDGRVVGPTPAFTLDGAVPIWSQDQIFVMDKLEELNAHDPEGLFTNHLNLEQLGVFGQSLGGSAALRTCFIDARCEAGASGDGPAFDGVFEQGLEQPFMQLLADGHVYVDQAFFTHVTGPFYEVRVESFQHMNFGDFPLWPNVDSVVEAGWLSSTDGGRSVELTRAALLAFFDRYLKGEDGTLEAALGAYPEITVTARNVGTS